MAMQYDYFRELAVKLDTAPHGHKRRMIESAAEFSGISAQTVYKRLHAAGWRSERKTRADKLPG
ncbi:MAG: hypothetical protein GY862_06885 [Gammaproteobacteria bacterium]|nr:hypothetical protein [Gammaproteobacteria bacterium]